jgi:hypothetical protein
MCGFRRVNIDLFCFDMLCHGYENLAIAQHKNMLCYTIIFGGGYWL